MECEQQPLGPAEEFMNDVTQAARQYIGDPILNDADAVAKDPILQLARELTPVDQVIKCEGIEGKGETW